MILVDDREGSRQLADSLQRADLPVEVTRLDYGDVYFVGRGQGGVPVNVGIEHKTVGDLINSLRSGRLTGHQLLGLHGEGTVYDFAWLAIEGELTYDARGKLMRRAGRRAFKPMPGGMTVDELYKRLLVLHLCGGLNPVFLSARRDTVRWITALYRTFTDKALDQHKSHLAIYVPAMLAKPSQFRLTVGTLPGVGPKVAQAAEREFKTIRRAMTAPSRQWAALATAGDEGTARRVGTSAATRIVAAITGEIP